MDPRKKLWPRNINPSTSNVGVFKMQIRELHLYSLMPSKQVERVQNPIHFYTNYGSANDLVMILCGTELRNYLHHGNLQGCGFHLLPNNMGFHHGQILIEMETDSFCAGPPIGIRVESSPWDWTSKDTRHWYWYFVRSEQTQRLALKSVRFCEKLTGGKTSIIVHALSISHKFKQTLM